MNQLDKAFFSSSFFFCNFRSSNDVFSFFTFIFCFLHLQFSFPNNIFLFINFFFQFFSFFSRSITSINRMKNQFFIIFNLCFFFRFFLIFYFFSIWYLLPFLLLFFYIWNTRYCEISYFRTFLSLFMINFKG